MITIQHLNKYYGKQQVLFDVSLRLEPGQCVAFVGPNGCGKTTLMKSILGLVTPQSGSISIDGLDTRYSPESRRQIGFMPQYSCFPANMTVRQVIDTLCSLRGKTLDEELYRAYHIEDMLDKRTGALSGGMQQKVSATLAFLFSPKILILDEPTASLDPLAAEVLKKKIRKESDRLVFITSHILSELNDIATHVVFMNEGRVLFFKPVDELLQETEAANLTEAVMNYLRKLQDKQDE